MSTNTPQEEPIPADFLEWAKEYAEKVYSDTPRSFRDHLHAELMCALGTAYRKLSQKAAPGPDGKCPDCEIGYVRHGAAEMQKFLTDQNRALEKELAELKAAPGMREAMADAYKLIKSGYWHNAADVLFTALNPNPFTPAAPSKPIEEEKPEDKK